MLRLRAFFFWLSVVLSVGAWSAVPDTMICAEGPLDKLPRFANNGMPGFESWVQQRVDIPNAQYLFKGRIRLGFTIEANGKMSSVRLLEGIDPKLDSAVLGVLKQAPRWIPGKLQGRSVPVECTRTIIYSPPPKFMGGTFDKFRQWIMSQMIAFEYPEYAYRNKIQGRVVVSFVVEKDGSVSNVTVIRSLYFGLDQEAVRVIERSPRWQPGYDLEGNPVRIEMRMPIDFYLKK